MRCLQLCTGFEVRSQQCHFTSNNRGHNAKRSHSDIVLPPITRDIDRYSVSKTLKNAILPQYRGTYDELYPQNRRYAAPWHDGSGTFTQTWCFPAKITAIPVFCVSLTVVFFCSYFIIGITNHRTIRQWNYLQYHRTIAKPYGIDDSNICVQ